MSARYWPVLVAPELRALAQRLEARYPGVKVLAADYFPLDGGTQQQCVRFLAPLDQLRAAGLVTDAMIATEGDGRRRCSAVTPIGDGYSLNAPGPVSSSTAAPGEWDLSIFTGAVPRERERFAVKDAERELRHFMLPKRGRRE